MFDIASKGCCTFILLFVSPGVGRGQAHDPSPKASPGAATVRLDAKTRADLESFARLGRWGQSLDEFLTEAAGRVSLRLVIDPAVPEEVLNQRVGLELRYSRVADALALAGELAGVRISPIGRILWVRPDGPTPVLWPVLSSPAAEGSPAGSDRAVRAERRQTDILRRIARMDLLDAALIGVVRALRDAYHVDCVVLEDLWADQPLISVRGENLSLQASLTEICRRIGARWTWRHGVIVLSKGPGPWARQAASERPAGEPEGHESPRTALPVMNASPSIDLSVQKIPLGKILTRLRETDVNTQDPESSGKDGLISLRGSGSKVEMIELLEAYPARPRPPP